MEKTSAASIRKHKLKNDRFELIVLPGFGCHWTNLRLKIQNKWHELLDPVLDYEALLAKKPSLGSYIMAPWSNRIAKAEFQFEGKRYQLRETFPDGTAIHGDVRHRPWQVRSATEKKFEATLDSRKFSDFNYPFALTFKHSVELSDNRILVRFSIENVDKRRAPVGFGFHPFLKRRLTEKDSDVIVMLPAQKVYPDEKCIPTGQAIPVSGRTDLRKEKLIGTPQLDHCYTALTSDTIRIVYPGSKVEVDFKMDPIFKHVIVYAPNNPDGTPRNFVAVEPATNVNSGFNLFSQGWQGTGVKVLEPGESWGGNWGIFAAEL